MKHKKEKSKNILHIFRKEKIMKWEGYIDGNGRLITKRMVSGKSSIEKDSSSVDRYVGIVKAENRDIAIKLLLKKIKIDERPVFERESIGEQIMRVYEVGDEKMIESYQDVINWLGKLNKSKYFETEEALLAEKVLIAENRKRSTISKDDEKKIHRICIKSYILLKRINSGNIPTIDEIATHLRTLRAWGFHD